MNTIQNFKSFSNENKSDLDPFNEEDWSEKDKGRTKAELVRDCVEDVMEDMYGNRQYIMDILREYFEQKPIDELREMLGENMYDDYIDDDDLDLVPL